MKNGIRHIKHGARPTRIKHTDYDFLNSHRLGGVTAGDADFKDEYFADCGLWGVPNQDMLQTFAPTGQPSFIVPAIPFGCTDYGQAGLANDLTKTLHNPMVLDAVTNANANHGCDIRTSLDAAVKIGWIKQYFNLVAKGAIDYFDTFRVAQVVGVNSKENRSITWGTPWFPSWEQAGLKGISIMPMPTDAELAAARNPRDTTLPWHDSKLDGWTTKNGILVYRDESWQGEGMGEDGFIFFPREVINMVMSIPGTVAFIATLSTIPSPKTVDVTTLQWIVSILTGLMEAYLPFLKK